ncbi:JmjC domain-containing protein [Streptomyces sp. NPDC057620]|uniref:JmjC domain-containing protein n=1 Tax=Streptomyces sp. NPDC057620 TaxID=3346185 RepID=UPI0036BC9E4B
MTATTTGAAGAVEAVEAAGPRDALRLLCRDSRTADGLSRTADGLSWDELPWGRAHAVFDASPDVAEVVARQDLEDWLDCGLLHYPVLNAMRGGTPVPPEELTRVMHVSGDPRGGYVDGAKVRAQLAAGATVVVQNLHEWHRPAQHLCRRLARLFSAKAGAVAFWTRAGEDGLRVHRDDGHLFVVQISGTKRWFLYDTPREAADWRPGYVPEQDLAGAGTVEKAETVEAVEAVEKAETVDLRAGQVLYLPEGIAHHTRTLDTESVHVTVAIREPGLRDTVELAVRACLARIPDHATLSGTPADRERAADDLLTRLADALGRVDRAALVRDVSRRAAETRGSR